MGGRGTEPSCSWSSLGKTGKLLPQAGALLADDQGCAFNKGSGRFTDYLVPANLAVQCCNQDLAAEKQ